MATYNPIAKATFSSTAFSYSPLLSDGDDVVSRSGTIASGGGIVKRGTILKIDPTTGAITVPAAATDCNCILANDTDATSTTAAANVYLSGKFKADAVIWPGALAHGAVADALRDYGILIESVVYTDGTLVKSAPTEAEAAEAQKHLAENRKAHDAASKDAEKPKDEEAVAPKPSDSAWGYLTAEEREKTPQLADPPVAVPEKPLLAADSAHHGTDPAKAAAGGSGHYAPPQAQPHTPPKKDK